VKCKIYSSVEVKELEKAFGNEAQAAISEIERHLDGFVLKNIE